MTNKNCCKPCPTPSPPCKPSCPPTRAKVGGTIMGCFISLIKTSIIFGTGVYTGVYVAQNYQIDKVDDPKTLMLKLQELIKSKSDGGK